MQIKCEKKCNVKGQPKLATTQDELFEIYGKNELDSRARQLKKETNKIPWLTLGHF